MSVYKLAQLWKLAQLYYSMRYDTASSTYTLQIKDVQRPDEGTYQCQIIVAIQNKVTRHVKLDVSQPPVIADNSTRFVLFFY